MDDNPEIRDRLNVNKSTYHNKRPRERFTCFIRGAKWMKINRLNGPSLIHDTSTWLNQSIQSIRYVCCWLDMPKNLPWKCFRSAFGHYVNKCFPASVTHAQTLPLAVALNKVSNKQKKLWICICCWQKNNAKKIPTQHKNGRMCRAYQRELCAKLSFQSILSFKIILLLN